MFKLVVASCCTLALVGCGVADKLRGRASSTSGAGVVLDQPLEPYDEARLVALIVQSVPESIRSATRPPFPADAIPASGGDNRLERTVGWFGTTVGDEVSAPRQNAMRDARNQIQGMVMAQSANLCNAYKLRLREESTNINFGLGTAAVLLGAAGAIVTGTASQALAGAAAAATGSQAEYNKEILANVTSAVIIPGIDKQRTALQQEILNRRCLGISSYTLSQALLDAVRYHSACSADVGVAVAGSAVSQSRTTSLADAKSTVDAINALRASLASAATPAPAPAPAAPAPAAKPAAGAKPAADAKPAAGVAATPTPTDAAPDNNPTVLLGDTINIYQCPTLTAAGLLTAAATPTAAPAAPANAVAPHAAPNAAAAPALPRTPSALLNSQVRTDTR